MELQVTCQDPKKGPVDFKVEPLIFTPENLKMFWEKASVYPTIFNVEIRKDFQKFLELFMWQDQSGHLHGNGIFWKILSPDDPFVGVFYLTDIKLPYEATVHFTFFDGRMKGRAPLAKEMIKYVFDTYKFARINCSLPVCVNASVFRYVDEIGFIKEGKKRKSVEFYSKYFDEILFGILRSEFGVE